MIKDADYEYFQEILDMEQQLAVPYPLLRFSRPFDQWGAHEGLEAVEKVINDLALDSPDSALRLRKLHLLRALLKQCLQHGFMSPGEPPPEPETEPREEESEPCMSVATTVQQDTELSESVELSESDIQLPSQSEGQSAEIADEQ